MDVTANYASTTLVTSFLFNTDSFRTPADGTFTKVRVRMRNMGLQTPKKGVTTFRVASAAATMHDETQVGVLRINISTLPVASQSVVQQINSGEGVTVCYIPVEFNDRAAESIPNSQPHIQLLNGIELLDFDINVTFKPLAQDAFPSPLKSLNMMMVMETDGSRSGNASAFSS